jgi:transcriptional regulator with XRE-family HTH domain
MTAESVHRTIAHGIRSLRAERRWSAAKLADEMVAAGVPWNRSIVANVEHGRRAYVTAEELVTLGRVFGVAPARLLDPSNESAKAEPQVRLPDPSQVAVITVPQAGKILGLSRAAAYQAAKRGEIPTIPIGRRLVVPTAKLRTMLGL